MSGKKGNGQPSNASVAFFGAWAGVRVAPVVSPVIEVGSPISHSEGLCLLPPQISPEASTASLPPLPPSDKVIKGSLMMMNGIEKIHEKTVLAPSPW